MKKLVAMMVMVMVNGTALGAARAESRNNELRVDLGFASTVGFGGLAYGRSLSRAVDFEASLGAGVTGAQLGGMFKLGAGSESHRFMVGAGLSIGTGSSLTDDAPVGWFNAEIGYQLRVKGGFTMTLGLGVTLGMAGQIRTCYIECGRDAYRDVHGSMLPTARIGFGYRF